MTILTTLYIIVTYAVIFAACAAGVLVPFIIHLNPTPGKTKP